MEKVVIDGNEYDLADASDKARQQYEAFLMTAAEIDDIKKIAIAETARLAFEREVIGGLPEVAHKTVNGEETLEVQGKRYRLNDFGDEEKWP